MGLHFSKVREEIVHTPFQSSKISYVRGPANEGGGRGTYSQSTSCNISRFHRSYLDRSPWQIGLRSLLSD